MSNSNQIKAVVIDDDQHLLKSYKLKLEKEGIDATVTDDPVSAVEIIRSSRPDVVVLDVLMPSKNGWDILRELQAEESLKQIPVIMVSNIGSQEKESEAVEAGASAYMVKSDTPIADIVAKIKQIATE